MVSSRKMKHDHSSVDLKIHLKENRNEKMKKNMAKKKKVTNRRKVAWQLISKMVIPCEINQPSLPDPHGFC